MGSSSDKRAAAGESGGEWLVNVADDVVLPMTTLEIVDRLRKARLSEQSLVWRVGMHDWTAIADVPQLRLAAGSSVAPAPAPRSTQPPISAQAEGQRRRITLPLGFPVTKNPANVQQPAASNQPLAVYDRPAASLTFSEAGRADWQRNSKPQELTPVPSLAAPRAPQAPPSTLPHSLAPTTAATDAGDRERAPSAWANLDELLSNERRADQRNSRRVLLVAAIGSATLAAIFAVWLLRSPASQPAEPPAEAAEPSEAPVLAPTLEAVAPPIASEQPPAAALQGAPRSVAPRFSRRPKRAGPATSASAPDATASDSPAAAAPAPSTGTDVAVVPLAPLEPTPAASAVPEAVPPPVVPTAPDGP